MSDGLLGGFERRRLPGDGVEIDALVGDSGSPLPALRRFRTGGEHRLSNFAR